MEANKVLTAAIKWLMADNPLTRSAESSPIRTRENTEPRKPLTPHLSPNNAALLADLFSESAKSRYFTPLSHSLTPCGEERIKKFPTEDNVRERGQTSQEGIQFSIKIHERMRSSSWDCLSPRAHILRAGIERTSEDCSNSSASSRQWYVADFCSEKVPGDANRLPQASGNSQVQMTSPLLSAAASPVWPSASPRQSALEWFLQVTSPQKSVPSCVAAQENSPRWLGACRVTSPSASTLLIPSDLRKAAQGGVPAFHWPSTPVTEPDVFLTLEDLRRQQGDVLYLEARSSAFPAGPLQLLKFVEDTAPTGRRRIRTPGSPTREATRQSTSVPSRRSRNSSARSGYDYEADSPARSSHRNTSSLSATKVVSSRMSGDALPRPRGRARSHARHPVKTFTLGTLDSSSDRSCVSRWDITISKRGPSQRDAAAAEKAPYRKSSHWSHALAASDRSPPRSLATPSRGARSRKQLVQVTATGCVVCDESPVWRPPAVPGSREGSPRPAAGAGEVPSLTAFPSDLVPKRRNLSFGGVRGRRTTVETNHLVLDVTGLRVKHALLYDVSVQPDAPQRLFRIAVEEIRRQHYPNRYPAYDGAKNLVAATPLPIPDDFNAAVSVRDEKRRQDREFRVGLQLVSRVDLSVLSAPLNTHGSLEAPSNALKVLDTVLRSALSGQCLPVGRSFFRPPEGQVVSLNNGYDVWHGIFQTPALGWRPFVNVDAVHKACPSPRPLVELLPEVCGRGRPGSLDPEKGLSPRQAESLKRFLLGLTVNYQIPHRPDGKRAYKVVALANPADQCYFLMAGNRMTVQEYFRRQHKVFLQYPKLPCLHVGSLKKADPIYLPMELCVIKEGQLTAGWLDDQEVTIMTRNSWVTTALRKKKIQEVVEGAGLNENPQVQEFGFCIAPEFSRVEARVLPPPHLRYRDLTAQPQNGVWQPSRLLTPKMLSSWIVLVLDADVDDDDVDLFVGKLIAQGKALGMDLKRPSPYRKIAPLERKAREQLEAFFVAYRTMELVVVVVPDEGRLYGLVKHVSELAVGVLTQCVKARTVDKMNFATAQNILLKINSKLNGINHKLSSRPECLQQPCMLVGADLSHPTADGQRQCPAPSLAALSASYDPNGFQYNVQYSTQSPGTDTIEGLRSLMRAHLLFFYEQTGLKPRRIVYFRDGVRDRHVHHVLRVELHAIREACSSMQGDPYEPGITFIVLQRRHHTRLFPLQPQDIDGPFGNVPPGTVVDTLVTHPTQMDFYLVSHASIRGVSRPTRYRCLWDDCSMSEDELQEMAYSLCFLFSRCTRSVCYPAPAYYARLASLRAKAYLDAAPWEQILDQRISERSEAGRKFVNQTPMHFV